jgi:competence protein ComEC
VLELQYGGLSVVLPGDIGQGVERDLVPLLAPAAVRALKVAHHGSVSSSGEEFLRALSPGVALLSAGAITRVSPVVLQRYEALSCPLFRTDRDGALTLESDGRLVAVHTFTGRRWEKAVSNRLSARRP